MYGCILSDDTITILKIYIVFNFFVCFITLNFINIIGCITCICYIGLSNRFVWMQDLYPLLKDDVLLFKTSISFIDHIQEFLGAILTCTPIVVPPFNEMKENPFYLVDILKVVICAS